MLKLELLMPSLNGITMSCFSHNYEDSSETTPIKIAFLSRATTPKLVGVCAQWTCVQFMLSTQTMPYRNVRKKILRPYVIYVDFVSCGATYSISAECLSVVFSKIRLWHDSTCSRYSACDFHVSVRDWVPTEFGCLIIISSRSHVKGLLPVWHFQTPQVFSMVLWFTPVIWKTGPLHARMV
jgi:hypothetical protein